MITIIKIIQRKFIEHAQVVMLGVLKKKPSTSYEPTESSFSCRSLILCCNSIIMVSSTCLLGPAWNNEKNEVFNDSKLITQFKTTEKLNNNLLYSFLRK